MNSNDPNRHPHINTNYGHYQQEQPFRTIYTTNTSSIPPPSYPYGTYYHQLQPAHNVVSSAVSHIQGAYYSHPYPHTGMPNLNPVMIAPPTPPQFNANAPSNKQGLYKPQNDSFHCDSCEISFQTESAFMSHRASHVKCTTCEFTASKKIVCAHFQSAHGKFAGRGLKTVTIQIPGSKYNQQFKICVGNHPDDIQAWIEERRKKFPTRANIASKVEKKKRLRDDPTRRLEEQKRTKLDDAVSKGKSIELLCHSSTALSTLMVGYDSSSDEENENKEEMKDYPNTNTRPTIQNNFTCNVESYHKTKQCKFFLRNGSCKNGDDCKYIHDLSKHQEFKANTEVRKQAQSERDRARNASKKELELLTTGRVQNSNKSEGNSLLRKLLKNDIRRERTLCLQLFRYIVDCNYLQAKRECRDEPPK